MCVSVGVRVAVYGWVSLSEWVCVPECDHHDDIHTVLNKVEIKCFWPLYTYIFFPCPLCHIKRSFPSNISCLIDDTTSKNWRHPMSELLCEWRIGTAHAHTFVIQTARVLLNKWWEGRTRGKRWGEEKRGDVHFPFFFFLPSSSYMYSTYRHRRHTTHVKNLLAYIFISAALWKDDQIVSHAFRCVYLYIL